jgi:hypothetical protein
MEVDYFRDLLVPVIGGLGIFMLGLELMSNGIQSFAVNRLRDLLGKIAGTPVKGVIAGTFLTGILQSSTAMTVMVVGLVNSGILGLRPAISVIMGANIGTTLGNGLIALPLGPLGLLLAGVFALIHVFSKNERVRNIALTLMGFALIFYGLNLLTGGLRPVNPFGSNPSGTWLRCCTPRMNSAAPESSTMAIATCHPTTRRCRARSRGSRAVRVSAVSTLDGSTRITNATGHKPLTTVAAIASAAAESSVGPSSTAAASRRGTSPGASAISSRVKPPATAVAQMAPAAASSPHSASA